MSSRTHIPTKHISASAFSVTTQQTRRMSLNSGLDIGQLVGDIKTVKLVFQIEVWTKPGQTVCVVGDQPELGTWEEQKAIPLVPIEMYKQWQSPDIAFEVNGNQLTLEYLYLLKDTANCREISSSRRLTIRLNLIDSFTFTVRSELNTPANVTIDTLNGCSLLRDLSLEEPFAGQLEEIEERLGKASGRLSLKRLLALCFYLKRTCRAEQGNTELSSPECCERLISITRILYSQMTEEIRPIVAKTVLWMGRCCVPFKEIMKSITNVYMIQHKKVDFGAGSEAVEGLLDELFDHSPRDGMGMVRVIVLNSIRGALQSLRERSTRPDLLLMYDVWISVLQRSYIQSQFLFSDPSNIPNLLHQVSILVEYCRLNAVCPEIYPLAEAIQDNSNPMKTRDLLAQILQTATWWLSRYVIARKNIAGCDLLGLKDFLIETGAEEVELLFPVLFRALTAVCHSIGPKFSLGLCLGTAAGKVLSLSDIEDIPSGHSAIIAVIKPTKGLTVAFPPQVKGVVQVGDSYLCSRLLAHCLQHDIPFGLVTREWRDRVDRKVELEVTQEKISLL